MRWFWLFILGLVVLTGGLYASRVRTKTVVAPIASPAIVPTRVPRRTVEPDAIPSRVVEPEPEPEPEEKIVQREVREELEAGEEEREAQEMIVPVLDPEPMLVEGVGDEIAKEVGGERVESVEEDVVEELPTIAEGKPTILSESESESESEPISAPTFEQLADGSLKIFATDTLIQGSGTQADPFVLDWVTLRAIERVYNPKKGKGELPAWLDVLDGKRVRIKGNTLVPVIATTTRELLVMQNPWDGCCIGIPPSPYDAIEVELNHDVDFGSSSVGYGIVEGVFVLDPYVVDGWVLGLYMIEEASYRSGEGVPFPDF